MLSLREKCFTLFCLFIFTFSLLPVSTTKFAEKQAAGLINICSEVFKKTANKKLPSVEEMKSIFSTVVTRAAEFDKKYSKASAIYIIGVITRLVARCTCGVLLDVSRNEELAVAFTQEKKFNYSYLESLLIDDLEKAFSSLTGKERTEAINLLGILASSCVELLIGMEMLDLYQGEQGLKSIIQALSSLSFSSNREREIAYFLLLLPMTIVAVEN